MQDHQKTFEDIRKTAHQPLPRKQLTVDHLIIPPNAVPSEHRSIIIIITNSSPMR